MFNRGERYEMDVERCNSACNRVNEALAALMRWRNVSTAARLAVMNAVLVPTLLYSSETWKLQTKNEKNMNAVEMQSVRMISAYLIDEDIYRMASTSEDVTVRMKKTVLSRFRNVQRMSDERMAKNIYDGKMSGKRGGRRPRLTFENTVSKIPEEGHVKSIRTLRRAG